MIKYFCDRCGKGAPLNTINNVKISKGSSDVEHMDLDTVVDKNVCPACCRAIAGVLYEGSADASPSPGSSPSGGAS